MRLHNTLVLCPSPHNLAGASFEYDHHLTRHPSDLFCANLTIMTLFGAQFVMALTLASVLSATIASPSFGYTELDRALWPEIISRQNCDDSTPCDCRGMPSALFCGDGAFNCTKTHVYQCDGRGGACDFGPRDDCLPCRVKCCGNGC
ncbi:hypothetical protein BKA62DRAFT_697785 [Auriculariales sp. MPI-PUGE-AT-0066]|nr:hypothetical protein BKA62DRAFT_697785 [Auriculariales sp. MPI-PUGE-AT-0066]